MTPSITFTSELWLWNGTKGSWHFITVPQEYAALIKAFSIQERGFGSVPVGATVGDSSWKTSIFPDSKSGSYVLPVKASVRKKEGLEAGKPTTITLRLLDI